MKWRGCIYRAVVAVLLPVAVVAQTERAPALLSMEGTVEAKPESRVTAVYGVSADDYLPSPQSIARDHLRPKLSSRATRPNFQLPDGFYFIGAPIFILIFLRILVIFLDGFEEKRKEELRSVAREVWDTE